VFIEVDFLYVHLFNENIRQCVVESYLVLLFSNRESIYVVVLRDFVNTYVFSKQQPLFKCQSLIERQILLKDVADFAEVDNRRDNFLPLR